MNSQKSAVIVTLINGVDDSNGNQISLKYQITDQSKRQILKIEEIDVAPIEADSSISVTISEFNNPIKFSDKVSFINFKLKLIHLFI